MSSATVLSYTCELSPCDDGAEDLSGSKTVIDAVGLLSSTAAIIESAMRNDVIQQEGGSQCKYMSPVQIHVTQCKYMSHDPGMYKEPASNLDESPDPTMPSYCITRSKPSVFAAVSPPVGLELWEGRGRVLASSPLAVLPFGLPSIASRRALTLSRMMISSFLTCCTSLASMIGSGSLP